MIRDHRFPTGVGYESNDLVQGVVPHGGRVSNGTKVANNASAEV